MIKKFLVAIVSFFVSLGIILENDIELSEILGEENLELLVFTIIFYIIINKILDFSNKRKIVIISIISVFLTFLEIMSIHINTSDKSMCFYLIKIIEWFSLFYIIINCIYASLDKFNYKKEEYENKLIIRKKNGIEFVIFFLVNAVIWIFYALKYYPGMCNYDVVYQFVQALEKTDLNNWHPILHTFIIKFFLNVGNNLFENLNIGVFLYNVIQFLIFDSAMTYLIYYLRKIGVNKRVLIIISLFIMLNPIYQMFSLNLTKDAIFSIMFLIDVILLLKLIIEKESFLKLKNVIIAYIAVLITCLLRHNGIYIFILTVPFIYYLQAKNWKEITVFSLSLILIVKIYNGPMMEYFGISNTSSTEMLSIPVQAIARIVNYTEATLTDEEKDEISKYMDYKKIKNEYDEQVSDSAKDSIYRDYYFDNKLGFFKLYFKLLIKYPKICFEAFIRNTYEYWSLDKKRTIFTREIYQNDLGIYSQKIFSTKILDYFDYSTEKADIPIISLIFTQGFWIWILIICLGYLLYKKEYRKSILFVPVIIAYLTILAGPVNGEYRYFYPIYICIPVLTSLVFLTENRNLNN